jgi:hypothetical protein
VFDECWASANEFDDSTPVKQCVRDEKIEFKP